MVRVITGLFFLTILAVIWALQPNQSRDVTAPPIAAKEKKARPLDWAKATPPVTRVKTRRTPRRALEETKTDGIGADGLDYREGLGDAKEVDAGPPAPEDPYAHVDFDDGAANGRSYGIPREDHKHRRSKDDPDKWMYGGYVEPFTMVYDFKDSVKDFYEGLPGDKRLPPVIFANEALSETVLKSLNMPGNAQIVMMGDHDAQKIEGWEQAMNLSEDRVSNIGVMFEKPGGERVRRYLVTYPDGEEPPFPTKSEAEWEETNARAGCKVYGSPCVSNAECCDQRCIQDHCQ